MSSLRCESAAEPDAGGVLVAGLGAAAFGADTFLLSKFWKKFFRFVLSGALGLELLVAAVGLCAGLMVGVPGLAGAVIVCELPISSFETKQSTFNLSRRDESKSPAQAYRLDHWRSGFVEKNLKLGQELLVFSGHHGFNVALQRFPNTRLGYDVRVVAVRLDGRAILQQDVYLALIVPTGWTGTNPTSQNWVSKGQKGAAIEDLHEDGLAVDH